MKKPIQFFTKKIWYRFIKQNSSLTSEYSEVAFVHYSLLFFLSCVTFLSLFHHCISSFLLEQADINMDAVDSKYRPEWYRHQSYILMSSVNHHVLYWATKISGKYPKNIRKIFEQYPKKYITTFKIIGEILISTAKPNRLLTHLYTHMYKTKNTFCLLFFKKTSNSPILSCVFNHI